MYPGLAFLIFTEESGGDSLDKKMSIHQYLEKIQPQLYLGEYTKCRPDWRYDNIRPRYDKLYYITDGEGYLNIDGREYIFQKGQLFLLPCNSCQTYYHISKNYLTKYWIHCSFFCGDKDLLEIINLPYYIEVQDAPYIKSLFLDIINSVEDITMHGKLYQKAKLLQLMGYYLEHAEISNNQIFKDDRIEKCFNYIEKNLQQEITIQSLSDLLHLHPNYLITYFHKATGMSPIEYVNNIRIDKAKLLIQRNPEIPISELAEAIGFGDASYFSRIFKKKVGFTPSEYKGTIER